MPMSDAARKLHKLANQYRKRAHEVALVRYMKLMLRSADELDQKARKLERQSVLHSSPG
jgi:hypothetical protein